MTRVDTGPEQLGALIDTRRGRVGLAVLWCAQAAIYCGIAIGVGFYTKSSERWVLLVLVPLAAAGLYAAFVYTTHALSVVSIFENGMTMLTPWSDVTIFYSEVVRFRYGVTRHYTNFSYTGTEVDYAAVSERGTRIALSAKYQEHRLTNEETGEKYFSESDATDELRKRLAVVVMYRMLTSLDAGHPVVFDRSIQMIPTGLVSLTGKNRGVVTTWDRLGSATMSKGVLQLFENGSSRARFSFAMSTENAWPFYATVLTLAPHLACRDGA